jgi:hypothetical protein
MYEVRLMRWHDISPSRREELQKENGDACVVGNSEGKEYLEYYVASHIRKVMDKIDIELQDEGVEVKSIREIAPVLAVLE